MSFVISTTIIFLVVGGTVLLPTCSGQRVACQSDNDCPGTTKCLVEEEQQDGETSYCENPFRRGCLQSKPDVSNFHKMRVCNSDDPEGAAEQGLCRTPFPQDAFEIRLFASNWDSARFEVWLLQILLSELLDVPTTIEAGYALAEINFYHPISAADATTSKDLPALENADKFGDCRNVRAANRLAAIDERNGVDSDSRRPYYSCAHFNPEVWDTSLERTQTLVFQDVLAPPQALGVLGTEGWYIPKFLAEKDPALLNYLGLQGEENRKKMADTFKRPTTWGDYCDLISNSSCSVPDGVALRAPENDWERQRMFDEENHSYIGHFRKTDKNDCDRFPHNCTGHIADYPCGWSSYTEAQTYHLDIALDGDGSEPNSGGYPYSQLREIWLAANATKENVIINWWSPDTLYQNFQGTDAEFFRVSLPAPTQECLQHRVTPGERCSDKFEDRVGDARGVCDESVRPLNKLILSRLERILNDDSIPEAIRSPAFKVLNLFTFSELQLDEIFALWKELDDPREAVCTWAAENVDIYLRQFVPHQYPRVEQKGDEMGSFSLISVSLGSATVFLVVVVACIVYQYRRKSVFRLAQVEFLALLLGGSVLTASSSILAGVPAANGLCVAEMWLVDAGYSLGLVPLIVKIGAVHRIVVASERYQRLHIQRSKLFGYVALISSFSIVFLILCTVMDPPQKTTSYALTEETLETGETVVKKQYFCDHESSIWRLVPIFWYMGLLFVSSIIAFQLRNVRSDFSESRTLPMLIYSHFIFAVLRLITYTDIMDGDEFTMRQVRSVIVSSDTLGALAIYFMPKLLDAFRGESQKTMILREEPQAEKRKGYEQSSAIQKSTMAQLHERFQQEPFRHPAAREVSLATENVGGGMIGCLTSPPISDITGAIDGLSPPCSPMRAARQNISFYSNIMPALSPTTEETSKDSIEKTANQEKGSLSPTVALGIEPLYNDTTVSRISDAGIHDDDDRGHANADSELGDDTKPLMASLQQTILEQQETIDELRKQLKNSETKTS